MSRRWLLFITLLPLVAGCSQKLPPAADPQRARNALQASLDAWQNGEKPESLQKRAPAIYFNDELWSSEKRLVKYQIESEAANGQGWRCDVLLTLQSDQPAERRIGYQIDTDPAIVIVQQP